MDTYYMSDCMSYGGSMRNPSYRDYEKFPYGSLESSLNSTMKNTYNTMQARGHTAHKTKTTKDSCPFCKEQKKRPLGAYLRQRGNMKRTESIMEDEEEEQENSANVRHHNHQDSSKAATSAQLASTPQKLQSA